MVNNKAYLRTVNTVELHDWHVHHLIKHWRPVLFLDIVVRGLNQKVRAATILALEEKGGENVRGVLVNIIIVGCSDIVFLSCGMTDNV